MAAASHWRWVGKIKDLDEALAQVTEKQLFSGEELRNVKLLLGYSIEEIEQLAPMAEDGKETLASMGDDTPSAVLSKNTALCHYFRQLLSGDEPTD